MLAIRVVILEVRGSLGVNKCTRAARWNQTGLWEADRRIWIRGWDTFYGMLASAAGPAVPRRRGPGFYSPTLTGDGAHDKVSDAEAKARADFDLRWKVALGIEVEDRPFAKSTLQGFALS